MVKQGLGAPPKRKMTSKPPGNKASRTEAVQSISGELPLWCLWRRCAAFGAPREVVLAVIDLIVMKHLELF